MSEYLNTGTEASWLTAIATRGLNPRRATISTDRGRLRIGNRFASETDYAALTVAAAGTTELALKTWCQVHLVALAIGAGSGAYARKIVLPRLATSLTGSSLAPVIGDTITLRLTFAASANPTIELRENDASGTLLLSVAGSGSAFTRTVQALWNGSAWELLDAGAAASGGGAGSAWGGIAGTLADQADLAAALAARTIALSPLVWLKQGATDGAGVVGNPAHPFGTWQAAYDAGGRVFIALPRTTGTYGSLAVTGDVNLAVHGSHSTTCAFGSITASGSINIIGSGAQNVSVASLTGGTGVTISDLRIASGAAITDASFVLMTRSNCGASTISSPNLSMYSCVLSGGICTASASFLASDTVFNSTVLDCHGENSIPATLPGNAAPGANGGDVTLVNCQSVGNITCYGGNGGAAWDDGMATSDNGAAGGNGGTITISRTKIVGTITAGKGLGGSHIGGGADGADGADSVLHAEFSSYPTPTGTNPGTVAANIVSGIFLS